ncbi:MAG TPA: hypothetical protein VFQ96_05565 [Microbacteriaceae bacterium]|nr:hypothetical protein [Microbacteriaceae bacterium]
MGAARAEAVTSIGVILRADVAARAEEAVRIARIAAIGRAVVTLPTEVIVLAAPVGQNVAIALTEVVARARVAARAGAVRWRGAPLVLNAARLAAVDGQASKGRKHGPGEVAAPLGEPGAVEARPGVRVVSGIPACDARGLRATVGRARDARRGRRCPTTCRPVISTVPCGCS